MDSFFPLSPVNQIVNDLRKCNEFTARFGLRLSEAQMLRLAQKRMESLRQSGRIEFGTGILPRLINTFCDSPFIHQDNYEDTLSDLLDAFYNFKNESMDIISDDELITFMKKCFDGVCQGSIECLCDLALYDLCRGVRFGYRTDD